MKTCKFCGEVKEDFLFVSGRYKCKTCHSKYLKDRRSNPEIKKKDAIRHSWYMKERRYGITEEMHQFILKSQNNQCAICLEDINGLGNIDHCHNSQKVRGILCRNCNSAIGQFEDNIERLKSAISYLKAHNAK